MSALGDSIRSSAADLNGIADDVDAALAAGGVVWPSATNCLGGTTPTMPNLSITGEADSGAVNPIYYDRLCDNMPDGSVVFLGHSMIQAMPVCLASPFGVNLGYGAQSTRRLLHHMNRTAWKSALQRAGAGVLFSGCVDGSNTAYYGSQSGAASTVVYMFDSLLKPWLTGKWVIVKPIPADERVSGFPTDYNEAMTTIGNGIDTSFGSVSGVEIVDCWADLVDGTGNLDPAYHIGDGQHPSAAGYEIICAKIKDALAVLGV